MIHYISTYSSSPIDTQTKHLCNYWLGFPPSFYSFFITFILFFSFSLLTHTFSPFAPHHAIHHPSRSCFLAESCQYNVICLFFSLSVCGTLKVLHAEVLTCLQVLSFTYLAILTRIIRRNADRVSEVWALGCVKHIQAKCPPRAQPATATPDRL